MMRLIFHIDLLLIGTQVSRIRKAFGSSSSAHRKWSKIQLFKMVRLGGFSSSDFTRSLMRNMLELLSILQIFSKGKSIAKVLEDAESYLVNKKLI